MESRPCPDRCLTCAQCGTLVQETAEAHYDFKRVHGRFADAKDGVLCPRCAMLYLRWLMGDNPQAYALYPESLRREVEGRVAP